MLAKFVETIASMAENKEHKIGADTYTDRQVIRVEEPYYTPHILDDFSTLDSIITMVKREASGNIQELPLFVHVSLPNSVNVFSSYDEKFRRRNLYQSKADVPHTGINYWQSREETLISLRANYCPTPDLEYLLNLLGIVTDESSVKESDNGITQTVTAKKGIQMNQTITIKPKVTLKPYRTFIEVDQPESEFILRMNQEGAVLIKEADGGAWRMKAKKNIYDYLTEGLKELIDTGNVVVTL
jgi:hypothetical protein